MRPTPSLRPLRARMRRIPPLVLISRRGGAAPMHDTPRRPPIAWEGFTSHDRTFLRGTLPDPEGPDVVFTVAHEVTGRYRVEDLLAVGEASVLLRALDLRVGRPVVIKALR